MANRKEYELLFALNAQMGSGFNGTFKSAQAAIQATQKEIQELKSARADISAYQKHQAAAEATVRTVEQGSEEETARVTAVLPETAAGFRAGAWRKKSP